MDGCPDPVKDDENPKLEDEGSSCERFSRIVENTVVEIGIRNRLVLDLLRVEEELGRELTKTEIIYHLHFWVQHLRKTGPEHQLRFDVMEQVFYERAERPAPVYLPDGTTMEVDVMQGLAHFVQNLREVATQFAGRKEEILKALSTGSLLIVSNHVTWLNLPIIIVAMNLAFGDEPDFESDDFKNFLDRFHTIIGPALTTYDQGFLAINTLSNILKTIPQTANGQIPELEAEQTAIGRQFLRKTTRRAAKNTGNIILLSPSGTTDKVTDEGKIEMQKPSDTTLRLITNLNKNASLAVVGTNDLDIFADRQLKPEGGNEHLRIGTIHTPGSIEDPEAVMRELASLVVDKSGETIGTRAS